MNLRYKLLCSEVHSFPGFENVVFNAVYSEDSSDENKAFASATPSANFTVQLTVPAVLGSYKAGEYYYFDSAPVSNV